MIFVLALLAAGAAFGDEESQLRDGGPAIGVRLAGTEDARVESKVFIVQLSTPSASDVHVSSLTRAAGKPTPGQRTQIPVFDKNSAVVQAQVQRLAAEQAAVIAKVGADI